ncbi:MAG: glycosyltransferase [Candidatus Dormibacter sp.]|nr:MAG: hypothetical protein DLM66_02415 [Candidatus Dormibacteraeota bacterium]
MDGPIWAERVLSRGEVEVRHFQGWHPARASRGQILLYQASTGSVDGMVEFLAAQPQPKTMHYHNITPSEFFRAYDEGAAASMERGRAELQLLAQTIKLAAADSEFNASELRELGVTNVHVIPPYVPPRLATEPNSKHLEWLQKTKRGMDLLFVGRVVPNKGHLNLLRVLAVIRRTIDPHARLFVVGGWALPAYTERLFRLRSRLQLEGVVFTGQVSDAVLAAHYRSADAFISMSEHEGYGLPLIEAMRFDLPVVAYDAAAVAETLGGAGVLLRTLDPLLAAEVLARLVQNQDLLSKVRAGQRARLAELDSLPLDEMQLNFIRQLAG